jgi:hypothetical protein
MILFHEFEDHEFEDDVAIIARTTDYESSARADDGRR